MRNVLLAIAVLAVALTLQGCGGPPSFVLDECKSKLTYTIANSTFTGVIQAQSACSDTFKAAKQQSLCLANGQTTITEAKANLLKPYVSQCGEFVMKEVCGKGSECEGKPDKLKPSLAFAAVEKFVTAKAPGILVDYALTLDKNIKAVTQKNYDKKFNSRVVPQVVEMQCTLNTETKVDDVRLTQPPISALSIKCNEQEKAAQKGGVWYTACVSAGTEAIIGALRLWKQNFIKRCATGTLGAVCPKGSACAIETSDADPQALTAEAAGWVLSNYDASQAQALVSLSNLATGWIFGGPSSKLFEVNGLEVTTTHLSTGGACFGAGFAIVGLGALLLARRRMHVSTQSRSILVKSSDLEEELEAVYE